MAAVCGLALGVVACGEDRQLVGLAADSLPTVYQEPLPDVSRDGDAFQFVGPDNGLLLVYFGYTNCPDVCPGTLTATSRALEAIGDEADRVSVAMVSVDPDRDLDVIAGFVQDFVPGAHAIATDDLTSVRKLALSFGADFSDQPNSPDPQHTDALYAVDDAGRLAITWPYPTDYDDIAADIEQLLDRYEDA